MNCHSLPSSSSEQKYSPGKHLEKKCRFSHNGHELRTKSLPRKTTSQKKQCYFLTLYMKWALLYIFQWLCWSRYGICFIWNQFNPKLKGKQEVPVNIINITGCSIIIIDFIKAIVIPTKTASFSRPGQVKSISLSHSNINIACAFLYLAILCNRG